MKRSAALFLLTCMALVLRADVFTRVTRAEQLTEDGEYVIGAKGGPSYPSFYILSQYVTGKRYFKALAYSSDVPATLPETEALVWHIVREGEQIALRTGADFVALKKENTALDPYDHVSWQVEEQSDGTFKLHSGASYFRIVTWETASYFKCLADDKFEGTLVIYKRAIPLSSLTSYSRFWEAAGWETVCLPFSCAVPQGFTAYSVSGDAAAVSGSLDAVGSTAAAVSGRSAASLAYEETSQMQAGVSYVVRGEAGALFSVEKTNSFADAPRPGLLAGTYAPLSLASGYVLNGTDFVPAAPGCYLPPFCAYLPQR